MRSNTADRMKDPFYAGLLYQIEHIICLADDEARRKAIPLTDSQIRSALIKTQKKLNGEPPDIPAVTEKDKILAALTSEALHRRLCDALRGNRAPIVAEMLTPDGRHRIIRDKKASKPRSGSSDSAPHHTATDMARALVEYQVHRIGASARRLGLRPATRVMLAGGGATPAWLRQRLAAELKHPLRWVRADPLLGAARMAAHALGGPRRETST